MTEQANAAAPASAAPLVVAAPPSRHGPGDDRSGYERTLISANSPFDRWRFGAEARALRAAARARFPTAG